MTTYYAVIPATVRYDKRLSDKQLRIYAEVTCLCPYNGYIDKSHIISISDALEIDTKTVWNSLDKLAKLKHIYKQKSKDGVETYSIMDLALIPALDATFKRERKQPMTEIEILADLKARKAAFALKIKTANAEMTIPMPTDALKEFYKTWTERKGDSRTMRFEGQESFEVKRRLEAWQKKNYNKNCYPPGVNQGVKFMDMNNLSQG